MVSLIPSPLTIFPWGYQGKVSATSSSSDLPRDIIVMNTVLLTLLFHYNNAAAVQPARGWPPVISLQICREIWKNPGFLTIQGLFPCITVTKCFPGGASRLRVADRHCWGPYSRFAQDLSLGGWKRHTVPQECWSKSPWQQIWNGHLACWVTEGHCSKKNPDQNQTKT